jgi:hypothetical protein
MDRREFTKIMTAVVAGMAAGSKVLSAQDAAKPSDKHVCAGLNSCKGKGGCASAEKAGKNDCSGKGGCATAERHGCAGKNSCKGDGGCSSKEKAGKNDCKGQGGCAVPLTPKAPKK